MVEAELTREHYRLWPEEDFGITLNNRAENPDNWRMDEALKQQCYGPFYKMSIDGNINNSDPREIWLNQKMMEIRLRLEAGDRGHSVCNKCDVAGKLHGKTSFDALMAHYKAKPSDSCRHYPQSAKVG